MLAAELMVVIYVSFSLRRRIGVRNWRRLHYLTFAVFAAATVHGLAAGTDRWAFGLYAGSVAAVAGLTAWRIVRGHSASIESTVRERAGRPGARFERSPCERPKVDASATGSRDRLASETC